MTTATERKRRARRHRAAGKAAAHMTRHLRGNFVRADKNDCMGEHAAMAKRKRKRRPGQADPDQPMAGDPLADLLELPDLGALLELPDLGDLDALIEPVDLEIGDLDLSVGDLDWSKIDGVDSDIHDPDRAY